MNALTFDPTRSAWVQCAGDNFGPILANVDHALAGLETITRMIEGHGLESDLAKSGNDEATPLEARDESNLHRAAYALALFAQDRLGDVQTRMERMKNDAAARTGRPHKWALVPD